MGSIADLPPLEKPSPTTPFKVLIIGGGVAGLTLACSLDRANIDFTLLEAHPSMTPQVGAAIGLFPNGSRILDQLGVYEGIKTKSAKFAGDWHWIDNGKLLMKATGLMKPIDLIEARFGYGGCFIQRRELLEGLWEGLGDKGRKRCEVNKKVTGVSHGESGVEVVCKDGSRFTGDVVVGADGVHSFVREQMWKCADEKDRALMEMDKNGFTSEYALIYGIAEKVPGVEEGTFHRSYHRGFSFMATGSIDATYFFAGKKLDTCHTAPNIPRFTAADTEAVAEGLANILVSDTVTFKDIWSRRRHAGMVAIEEAHIENWTWGRFACVGDSVHKMTPNAGHGGSAAMESAAALANVLYELVHGPKGEKITHKATSGALRSYRDRRYERSEQICGNANGLTRIDALDTWQLRFLLRYFFPNCGDVGIDGVSSLIVGAESLEFLPQPERAKGALMGFDRNKGHGKDEDTMVRVMRALPLLTLSLLAWWCMRSANVGTPKHGAGVESVFTGWKWFDGFVSHRAARLGMIGIYEKSQRFQLLSFLTDLTSVVAIWLIESRRRASVLTVATIPLPFMLLMQHFGISIVAPPFLFLCYISLWPSTLHSADNRLVPLPYSKTLLPALVLGYIIPSIALFWPKNSAKALQGLNFVWYLFPLILRVVHGFLSRFVKNTTLNDKLFNPTVDVPYLRGVYLFCTLLSTAVFNYVRCTSSVSLARLSFANLLYPKTAIQNFAQGFELHRRYTDFFLFAAMAVWITLQFGDLKRDGRIRVSWAKIAVFMFGGLLVGGPGAMCAGMWWWRESLLVKPKEDDGEKAKEGKIKSAFFDVGNVALF